MSPRKSKWKGKGKAGRKKKLKKSQVQASDSECENEVDWSGMVEEYGSLVTISAAGQRELNVPFHSQFDPEAYEDSRVAGRELFGLLISPFTIENFYRYVHTGTCFEFQIYLSCKLQRTAKVLRDLSSTITFVFLDTTCKDV